MDTATVPGLHAKQVELALFVENKPAGHGTQSVMLVLLVDPDRQVVHAMLPWELVTVPLGHDIQLKRPGISVNEPGEQSIQDEAPVMLDMVPVGHCVHTELPFMLENRPGMHLVHEDKPAASLMLPAMHAWHAVLALYWE